MFDICKECLLRTRRGDVPVVVGSGYGHKNHDELSNTTTIRALLAKHDKMHAVYVSEEDSTYTLNAVFDESDLAERYCRFLNRRNQVNYALVASARSSTFLTPTKVRSTLDKHGHHYMIGR